METTGLAMPTLLVNLPSTTTKANLNLLKELNK
jgi:hypothetical protein